MKSILFVSYHFYPSAAVGAKRLGKFCKYLPEFGVQPVVLTVEPGYYDAVEPELTVPGIKVYRTRALRLRNPERRSKLVYYIWRFFERLMFPDGYLGWLPSALGGARKAFDENRLSAVYVSGPWFSSFLIAFLLHRIYKVPLVIEYRDQWSLNPVYKNKRLAFLHRYFDRVLLGAASRVVFVSRGLLQEYQAAFPGFDFSKAAVIPNSFDPEAFPAPVPRPKPRPFTISYAGNFYWPRTPDCFLQAIHELHSEGRINAQNFRFTSIGNLSREMMHHDMDGLVELRGRLPHTEALAVLAASDVLLLIVAKEHRANIPAKLFEYLAAQKPVLALCPPGSAVADILAETGGGLVADIDDVTDVKCRIMQICREAQQGGLRPDAEKIANYRAPVTTGALADLLAGLKGRHSLRRRRSSVRSKAVGV